MNTFWLIAAALVFAVVGLLLPAAFRARGADSGRESHRALHARRLAELKADLDDEVIDRADGQAAEDEITRALLEEADAPAATAGGPAARWLTTAAIALVIPAIALLTYSRLGQPTLTSAVAESPVPEAISQQSIEALLAQLEQRLTGNPDNAEGWLLLGRSYMAMNRYGEAAAAFERAYGIVGDVPQVMLQYADALAMTNDGRIGPQPRDLVERTLALEPDNIVALWLAGLGAAETGERELALERLTRARALSAERGRPTAELDAIIAGIGGAGAGAADGAVTVAASPEPDSTSAITVNVTLDPALAGNVRETDVLFVFARSPQGGGPPLAVVRVSPDELPRSFVLDETRAMAPQFRLTPGATVDVTARISRNGSPTAAPGDLQGTVAAVTAGQDEIVAITIGETVE